MARFVGSFLTRLKLVHKETNDIFMAILSRSLFNKPDFVEHPKKKEKKETHLLFNPRMGR